MNNWKTWPTWLIDKVSKKHGYEVGEFLYLLANDELPDEIYEELENSRIEAEKNKSNWFEE